ncbi:MAG: Rid family detoxifying hydrolase, partial [Chloroflexota bacterium]|nr:Rid family detoxifying hydrolase [Chloroflexota bacterium]
PQAVAAYSQALIVGTFVYTSGQIGLNPESGKLVVGGVQEQTQQVLENVRAVLRAAGSGLDLAVKNTCYLADMSDFGAFNEVYGTFFPSDPPARTTIGVAALPQNARVEIETVALVRRT